MLSNAHLYSEYRGMQVRDAEPFLRRVIKKMDWSTVEQDILMDIGCGTGDSCSQILLPELPDVKKMIGVDVLPSMIEFARKNNAHEKIEYHIADIEDRSTIEKWTGQMSKIVSIYCLNWLGKQKEAFKNIYHILKTGGEAALIFMLNMPFWNSYSEHIENPRWSKYLENVNPHVPESHYKNLGASYYRNLLEDIGFDVIICEAEKRIYTFRDDDECRHSIYSRCGLSNHIPDELKSDFKEALFQGFVKHNGRDADGHAILNYSCLTLLIQKPKA